MSDVDKTAVVTAIFIVFVAVLIGVVAWTTVQWSHEKHSCQAQGYYWLNDSHQCIPIKVDQ